MYCYGAQTCVKRMINNYKFMFGELLKEARVPLEKDDEPKLDETPELGPDGIGQFQSLIGAVQWMVTLSHLDIAWHGSG